TTRWTLTNASNNAPGNVADPRPTLPPPIGSSTSQQSGAGSAPSSRPTVGYVYSSEMMAHAPGPTLQQAHVLAQMKWLPIRTVKKEEAMLVHSEDHWDKVVQIQRKLTLLTLTEQERMDSHAFYEAIIAVSMQSCGGTIEATLAVARGDVEKSFAIVRPPGHHAEPDEHMVAARVVQQVTPLKRILILDCRFVTGNGTQRAFNDDPSVLYISIHRHEAGAFYPCGPFGGLDSSGVGEGEGYSTSDYLYAFHQSLTPEPLCIISAGFDAAEGDDLGECHVSPAGLAGGKLVGGYNVESISNSELAVARILLGEAPPELPSMVASPEATETVWLTAKHQSKYWRNIEPQACEPREDVEALSFSIPQVLKAHQYDMMEIPLAPSDLDQRFSSQVMCTPDMLTNNTIIVFIHEFGNLRMELNSSAQIDVDLQRSYLVDISKQMIGWVRREGHALIDVNLYPKPVEVQNITVSSFSSSGPVHASLIMLSSSSRLSSAQRVVLVAHGSGCKPLADLLRARATSAMKIVKWWWRLVDADEAFYPGIDSHPVFSPSYMSFPDAKKKAMRHFTGLAIIDEPKPLQLMMRALPHIETAVKTLLQSHDAVRFVSP
ncbi:histone deacetylase clr3, partial [Coprinopsis sp. MPI-PUGE-AT-0042]